MAKKDAPVMEPEPEIHKRHHEQHHEQAQHGAPVEQHPWEAAPPKPPPLEPPSGIPAGAPPQITLAAIPPLLGKTPTGLSQILVSNLGERGTRHVGPIVSGGQPGGAAVAGSALCALQLQVDRTMGAFSLPIQFPKDCQLLWTVSLVYTAFTGGTGDSTYALGTTSGAADILAATVMGAAHATALHAVAGTIPYGADANPGQIWFTVAANGNTAGVGIVTLIYTRAFLKWN